MILAGPIPRRARRPRLAAVALSMAVALAAAACSTSAPTEAEARRQRVEARLDATFSKAQSDCILDHLDEDALVRLDRKTDLTAEDPELATYSQAVVACVADPNTTTTSPATSTTAPATTTTAPPAPTTSG